MNAGIEDHPVPDIGLQASANLLVLFEHAYFKPLHSKQVATDKSAHSAPDYYHVKIRHTCYVVLQKTHWTYTSSRRSPGISFLSRQQWPRSSPPRYRTPLLPRPYLIRPPYSKNTPPT